MCTAFSCNPGSHYFGRNLDLDHYYNETVTICPRGYAFHFRHVNPPENNYAIIGIATVIDDYPLYYDGMNEKGLCMAGLNFPGNAVYKAYDPSKENIAPFELIPWVLRQCETAQQAGNLLSNTNLLDCPFREELPPTPLHWIISDKESSITVEPMKEGLKISENIMGVLTNNPPFSYHKHNLINYMNLTPRQPHDRFSRQLELKPYSLGMGAIGLPGDFSSASRFVRCAFIKENTIFGEAEKEKVGQVFHTLDAVSQFDGCVETPLGYEKTLYSICCNADAGILYYTTYHNRQISAVNMNRMDLNGSALAQFPLINDQQIYAQN